MWMEILGMAVSNGLWAVLFCCLLFYQVKDSRKREIKYQNTIDALADRLKSVNEIRENIAGIDNSVKEIKVFILKRRKNESAAAQAV